MLHWASTEESSPIICYGKYAVSSNTECRDVGKLRVNSSMAILAYVGPDFYY